LEFDLEFDLDLPPPPLAGLRDEPRLNPAKLGMSGIVTGCEKKIEKHFPVSRSNCPYEDEKKRTGGADPGTGVAAANGGGGGGVNCTQNNASST
jgi:hypothetical protein